MLDANRKLLYFSIGLGSVMWVLHYAYFSLLLIYAQRITRKLRVQYLKSLLAQDISFFELNNSNEMAAQMGKQLLAIQKATGEKIGSIIMSFTMCLFGVVIAFIRGWLYTLTLLVVIPFIFVAGSMMISAG